MNSEIGALLVVMSFIIMGLAGKLIVEMLKVRELRANRCEVEARLNRVHKQLDEISVINEQRLNKE